MDKIEVTQADKNCARNIRNAWDVSCDTAFEIAAQHRILATRTDATPVAWMYEREDGSKDLVLDCNGDYARRLIELGATETALYPDPPATDVAALVDALKWYMDQMCEGYCEGYDPRACAAIGPDNCAGCPAAVALAPFTKGQP